MAKTNFRSVEEYIASQPEAAQAVLKRVRSIIRKTLPRAEEVISYQIPAYKVPGGTAIFFAGWKQHYSLYPASGALAAAFKEELAPYQLSKGTIRLPLHEKVPARLIERIAKFRAKEVAERKPAAKAKTKSRVRRAPSKA